jgi:hypothetical protein
VPAQEEGPEEGAVGGEHAEIRGEHEQPRGHRGHDLLRVALEVEDGALLLDLITQERGTLPLAPEAEEETGEGQGEEARREAGEPPRLIEVGERLLAVDLDHEAPSRGHDPACRRERGSGAVVEHLAERVPSTPRQHGRQGSSERSMPTIPRSQI